MYVGVGVVWVLLIRFCFFFYQHCYLACMSTGVIDQLRLYDRAQANMIMLNRQIVLSHLNDLKSFIGKLNINIFLLFLNIDFIITIVSIALNALCAQLKYVRLNGFDKDTLSND